MPRSSLDLYIKNKVFLKKVQKLLNKTFAPAYTFKTDAKKKSKKDLNMTHHKTS